MKMDYFYVTYPNDVTLIQNVSQIDDVCKLQLSFCATKDVFLQRDEIIVGFRGNATKSAILTHQLTMTRSALPFAFPGAIALTDDGVGVSMVFDYYKTSVPLRFLTNNDNQNGCVALVNDDVKLAKGQTLQTTLYYSIVKCNNMFELIGKCADVVFEFLPYVKEELHVQGGQNVCSYKEASLGLISNLMDKRAIVNDGTGTFNPYGYHEIGAYSESFACMDVAKGFYRFATSNGLDGPAQYIKDALYHLCDTKSKHPWIADCHNTKGFFHFAWGAIPQDSGVDPNIKREDLFSDYCGHEEGENLLSTFKYFDRVNLLGEMALVQRDEVITQGFLKILPFTESLRNEDFSQPVTYNLDTHVAVTGNDNGGSGGGAALYALIQFVAYQLTGEKYHLDYALKSVDAANKLDYDRMFSMRCAPKPIALGALVRANVYAYEQTSNQSYLDCARKVAKGIFASYYLNPHPYCFFSTVGFGYACAQERWEAFREMEEALWLMLPYLKYSEEKSIYALYELNRRSALCALPINGNPYGNLDREYESFGGEYIPYEFSTGHIGDNPGLCGGCQSDRRQIKEIYGSGELFLATMMYENYARSHNVAVSIINVNCCGALPTDSFEFGLFNSTDDKQTTICDFDLPSGSYTLQVGDEKIEMSSQQLANGVRLEVKSGVTHVVVTKTGKQSLQVETQLLDKKPSVAVNLAQVTVSNLPKDAQFVVIIDENELINNVYKTTADFFTFNVDTELSHEVIVKAVCPDKILQYQSVSINALTRQFAFFNDFASTDHLTCDGFDCVSDLHSWMFYRSALDVNLAKITVDMGNVKCVDGFVELQIGAINNGTKYDVCLQCANDTIVIAENCNVAKYFTQKVTLNGNCKLIITATTNAGLGLSLTKLNVCNCIKASKSVVLPLQKKDGALVATLDDNYRNIVVAVENMTSCDEFAVYIDDDKVFNDVEKQFMFKVNRSNRGVYRFAIPHGATKIKIVADNAQTNMVKCVRLTQSNTYPVFTQYFDKKEVRKFYDK